jgi:hypothetical protein
MIVRRDQWALARLLHAMGGNMGILSGVAV